MVAPYIRQGRVRVCLYAVVRLKTPGGHLAVRLGHGVGQGSHGLQYPSDGQQPLPLAGPVEDLGLAGQVVGRADLPGPQVQRARCRSTKALAATAIRRARSAPHREQMDRPRKLALHTGQTDSSAALTACPQ